MATINRRASRRAASPGWSGLEFAAAYAAADADQNDRDHRAFVAAVNGGSVAAEAGV